MLYHGCVFLQVTVLFIDFGDKETLHVDRLCELPQSLYKFPIQAVPCSLQHPQRAPAQTTDMLNTYSGIALQMTVISSAGEATSTIYGGSMHMIPVGYARFN